jgi:catechol 2,3-dioxygenase-like lactoylglutathione lyase family enzyme
MILGVHHAAIAVPDLAAGLDFYAGVLGFEICSKADLPPGFKPISTAFGIENAACRVRMIREGNSYLELFEFEESLPAEASRPVNRIGITHIALATDDAEADYKRLEGEGVVFNAPLFGAPPSRFAYGRDPFGNVIELLEHDPDGESGRDFG